MVVVVGIEWVVLTVCNFTFVCSWILYIFLYLMPFEIRPMCTVQSSSPRGGRIPRFTFYILPCIINECSVDQVYSTLNTEIVLDFVAVLWDSTEQSPNK